MISGETVTQYGDGYYEMACCVCGKRGRAMCIMPHRINGLFSGQLFACNDDCWHRLKDAVVDIHIKPLTTNHSHQ